MELVLLNLILAIMTSFIAVYTFHARPHRRARYIALMILGASVWCYGYALEMFNTELSAKLFWANIQIIGMVLTNVWPLFVAHFTGRDSLAGKKGLIIFSIAPALTLTMLFTNDLHGLIFSEVTINSIIRGFH